MRNKFKYILEVFYSVYDLKGSQPGITYGDEEPGMIHIEPGENLFMANNEKVSPDEKKIIWKSWAGTRIPFLFNSIDKEIFIEKDGKWIIQFDIIAASFFLLSGWQELSPERPDQFGRFSYTGSIQKKLGITHIPVVNYYFDILRTVIESACQVKIRPVLSDPSHPYTICLSHDIDTCESAWLEGSYAALKKKDIVTPVKLVLRKLAGKDAWFNFNEILSIEKSYGANSTFFFLPTNKVNLGIKNADYDLHRKKFTQVFHQIIEQGSEVGLHGSAGSSTNTPMLKNELRSFPMAVTVNRFHFLLFDPGKSIAVMDEAGLSVDSTLGFAESPGFRNSFCYPFKPFDPAKNKAASYFEIPLVLMDGTLQKYMGLLPHETEGEISKLIHEVSKFHGVMTVLWHNTHFSPYKYPGWKEVYTGILDKGVQDNAWLQSCSQVMNRFSNV